MAQQCIVEALTTATEAKDLAGAFEWVDTAYSPEDAHHFLQHISHRSTLLHGNLTPHGSVPVPSRSLNNEFAYMIFRTLRLEFDVRLTGLRAATHFNGRDGIIRDHDPANRER